MDESRKADDTSNSPLYIMESEEESLRLELKTDPRVVEEQGRWAGVVPGMRVLDLGCGPGKTTQILRGLAGPEGEVIGLDSSARRIDYANRHYADKGVRFVRGDAREPPAHLGRFDLVWVRFLLEYYEQLSYGIAKSAYGLLEPGGTLCLIDLDHNCLGHFGGSARLERTLRAQVLGMQRRHGFDPFVGRKLYSYLYDLGCLDIEVRMSAHHIIYGPISEADRFNWLCKAEAARNAPGLFVDDYPGGFEEFHREFCAYLDDPRRFIYTPLVLCKGKKPAG
jgi:ubiquinone/menaquinone biosynthesis C-methylase UbiE